MDANDWLRVRREEGGNPSVNYALFVALRREGRLDEAPAARGGSREDRSEEARNIDPRGLPKPYSI